MLKENIINYWDNFLKINSGYKKFNELDYNIINNFNEYLNCLLNWSKTHNIISSKFSSYELIENLFDSFVSGKFLDIKGVINDAGSGGGFPGIPLALVFPKASINLIESDRKKCSFLRVIKNILKIENIKIYNNRIEEFKNLDFIISKAAFSPAHISVLGRLLAEQGKLGVWATPKNKESFTRILHVAGLKLVKEFDYKLVGGQERVVQLFIKACP
jgi:16S rRNA (guanine527-N7)-methyltransferase